MIYLSKKINWKILLFKGEGNQDIFQHTSQEKCFILKLESAMMANQESAIIVNNYFLIIIFSTGINNSKSI